jgi:predicted kinase
MKIAYILRGIPGSGKTTLAKKLAGDVGRIHSTDDFFMRNGQYCFDPGKLAEYHAQNLARFQESVRAGIPVVVCDNTNIRRSHFAPYVAAAQNAGYEVRVISLPHPPAETAAQRNTHGVSQYTIQKMLSDWEP